MQYQELTQQIIGCAYTVYNKLGFGFLEKVYRNAMMIELNRNNLFAEEEKPLQVYYDDYVVGEFSVDIFVENRIVVELKSVQNLISDHEVQVVNYLQALRKDVDLLINFAPKSVEVKRKYRKSVRQD
jgi:GxxExxY protein